MVTNNDIGEANYDSSFTKRPNSNNANWSLNTEGSHPYRVLPPFGSLASSGQWAKYERLHWGFYASNKKQRPFRCVRRIDSKTKTVIQECPQCLVIDARFEEGRNYRETLIHQKKSQDEIKLLMEKYSTWNRRFNTEKRYFMNVLRPDGQIGRLKISKEAFMDLRAEVDKLRRSLEHTNPVGRDDGVWFDFHRTGMHIDDTKVKVTPVYETVNMNGRPAKVLKDGKLTPEIMERMKTEMFDLGVYYRDLSRDEIQRLADAPDDSEVVDSIFGAPVTPAPSDPNVNEFKEMAAENESEVETIDPNSDEELALVAKLEELRRIKKDVKSTVDPKVFFEHYKANK